jgi:hypothetical protein
MAEFNLGRIRFVWKGAWVTSTSYIKDDVVRYGGKTYLCVIGHTAAADFNTDLENIPTRWNQMSDGQEWKGNWSTSTFYKLNDIVKYGGYIYICNDSHTSAATATLGLEQDLFKWDLFAETFDWKTDWTTSTRYKINDIVKYGGITYICNQGHTSAATATLGLEQDQGKWDFLHKGIDYLGTWSGSSVRYKINDVVKYGAGLWICTTYHTSSATFAESNWTQFVEGLEFNDTWNASAVYQPGDTIAYGGYVYISKTNHTNQVPTSNSDDWDLYITGFKYQGAWGLPNFYRVGNVVRHGGYTYVAVADAEASGANVPPNATYWAQLNSGTAWRGPWDGNKTYILGDLVKYGPNSFICINPHTSSTPNRPDNDTAGTYWNVFTAGSELSVLTTQGDLVYYGGAGPTRLPIGREGQVLRVSSSAAPEWAFWGIINCIAYVSPSGEDLPWPNYGPTIDRPFKTIQFASQQIEKGMLYPEASNLIARNRQFIQKEVVSWTNAQVAGPISPFTGAFTFNSAKCERDIGVLVDAIVYDLSHGGNKRIRDFAIYNGEEIAIFAVGEKLQTIAAVNFALSLVQDIISEDTITPYQGTVTQVIDATKEPETAASTIVTSLIGSLTASINAVEDSSSVFDLQTVNYTISVKTGTFNEVLPIIVPSLTAIVGDELRSTRIEPAGSLIAAGDVTYSMAALTRLAAIVSNIVQNVSIVKSTGNPLNQVTSRPAGSVGSGTAAANLFTTAKNYIDFYVNSVGTAPAMRGTNYWTTDENYYRAVNILEENKEFLAEEAVAYINVTYPAYAGTYDEAACKRDVREYVDAIKYDLVYSANVVGNYKTLTAARLYVNAVNGSIDKDMFYLRNGTGLRNCTTAGLTGTLSAPNIYGTRRPSAGAYTSLDPGWGPDDERVWITHRSPYVQNVTTFGTACIGLKVDGNIHNGGNDSIVANDFTQVLSDGIGAWVTNLGRAELVSVFSYYGHIGYLAENGGKIRATNGNSSYGTYGTVSEGIDVTETPVSGKVDNRSVEASIESVFTDSVDQIYRLEFANAGINYSTATFTFNGPGANAAATPEFRDNGVYYIRLKDFGDSSGTGGAGYKTISNTAQAGNTTTITLSATDTAISSAYVGMRILITAGTGLGQYGYIQSYNSGSKIATIYKESTGSAGWDHVNAGTTIASTLDVTTAYIIEPRLTFTSPGFTSTARTIQNAAWADSVFGDLNATYTSVASSGGSGAGAVFTVVKSGSYYTTVTCTTPGSGYKIDDTITIAGANVGGATPANNITVKVTKVVSGGVNTFDISGTAAGGRFVAVAGTTSSYSADGVTWTAGGTVSVNAIKVAYGNGTWIAISSTGTTSISTDGGTTWTAGGSAPAGTYTNIAYGNSRWVMIGTTTTAAYSINDGTSWVAMTSLPSASWTSVVYGNGLWVAVASSGTTAASSSNGTSWTTRTITSGNWGSVTFGKNKFVAFPAGGTLTTAVYSLNGTTWSTMTVPSATYTKVSYGQGLFFAVSQSTAAATSEDGFNWTSRTMSTSANGYSSIVFGNSNRSGIWSAVQAGAAGTVASSTVTGCTTYARALVTDERINSIRVIEPGSGYSSAPAVTIVDPNNTAEAATEVRKGVGVLAQPNFSNRGTGYETAQASVTGNGTIDTYQTGTFIAVKNLTAIPRAGSNVQFSGINDVYYKLVNVTNLLPQGDRYTAILQVSPGWNMAESADHETDITIRIRYSQVRLTGHDFLDIGTGNFTNTNYPGIPLIDPDPDKETNEFGGGRVFYTSTDQDGNFRVGDIFSVEQSTGVASLNAEAFSIAGLQELQLGSVALGGTGATITEFSTDPYFTADSDSLVPTQRAIKAYISAQIGSGSSSLNVNSLTAGIVYIAGDTITTTTGAQININTTMNFNDGIDGYALAYNLFR